MPDQTTVTYPGYWVDAAERVFWTLVQAGGGALLDVVTSGEVTWKAALYAVGLAIVKVAIAKSVGQENARLGPDSDVHRG